MYLFVSYEQTKRRYLESQRMLETILNEKEELFTRTQPKAVVYDKEKVTGGKNENAFEDYIIAKERKQIDQRLDEAKALLEDRKKLLALKETDLRQSKDVHDRVYVLRVIEGMTIRKISRLLHYEDRQIYRYWCNIRRATGRLSENVSQ